MFSRRFDREILALALPALGALAADPLVSLIDTVFVGRLGTVELAALGLNAAIFSLAFFLFIFLAYGTTPLVGRALGRGDAEGAGRTVTQAFTVALLIGVVVLALLQLFAEPILSLMGAGEDTAEPALRYLRIRALATPAVMLITAGNGAFRGFLDTRTPLWLSLGVSCLNLILDPLLIFTFGWGIAGAAWATTVAQWLGAAGFLALLFGIRRRRYHIPLKLPRLRELLPLLKIGGTLSLRTLALLVATMLATAIAARLGVLEVAAHQVALQLWIFLALVVDALAVSGQALVARYLGENRTAVARALSDRLLGMGLLVGLGLGFGFLLLQGWLPTLFSNDPAVIETLGQIYLFVALMQPLNALVFVWDGIFMGVEDFAFLAGAMAASALVASLLLLLVIPLGWGLPGVWWALVALNLVRAVTQAVRYLSAGGGLPGAPREGSPSAAD